jgi:hypothetical protein
LNTLLSMITGQSSANIGIGKIKIQTPLDQLIRNGSHLHDNAYHEVSHGERELLGNT